MAYLEHALNVSKLSRLNWRLFYVVMFIMVVIRYLKTIIVDITNFIHKYRILNNI